MPPDFQNATVIFYKGLVGLITPLLILGVLLCGNIASHGKLRQRFGTVLTTGGTSCLTIACVFYSYEVARAYIRPEPEIAISSDGMWCRSWGSFWMPWSEMTGMTFEPGSSGFRTYTRPATANFKFKPETVGNYPWTGRTSNVLKLSSANCNVQGLDHFEDDIFLEIKRAYKAAQH